MKDVNNDTSINKVIDAIEKKAKLINSGNNKDEIVISRKCLAEALAKEMFLSKIEKSRQSIKDRNIVSEEDFSKRYGF